MIDNLRLLAGLPIHVDGVGYIHQLTLRRIAELREDTYNTYLNTLCFDINDIDTDVDLSEFTTYDVIVAQCLSNDNATKRITKALSEFVKDDVTFIEKYGVFIVGDDAERIIRRDNYEDIRMAIRQMNFIQEKKKETYNPANEKARELIEKIKKMRKEAPKPKSTISLHSIISAVAWKSNIGIKSVWDLTIYQLFDAYYRLDTIDHYTHTLNGIYAGTVDSKKIDMKDINWSKIIKFT